MSKICRLAMAIALAVVTLPALAQSEDDLSIKIEKMQSDIDQLKADQLKADQLKAQVALDSEASAKDASYKPTIFGVVMTTFSVNTYNGESRFNVHNSRFGVKGAASENLSYSVQVDFSNDGSDSVLDSYAAYKYGGFTLKMGQQHNYVTTDLQRGPSSNLFTTRSYAAIYSLTYYDGAKKGLGSRDLGAYLTYAFKLGEVPISLGTGAFNGNGINNPVWDNNLNFSSRVMIGGKSGVSGEASWYTGRGTTGAPIDIYSAQLRYACGGLFLESTYQHRKVETDGLQRLDVGYLQGYYKIFSKSSRLFDYIAPTLRYDIGRNLDYILVDEDGDSIGYQTIDASRLSATINIALKGEAFRSRFSIGYEKVFMDERPSDINYNPLFQDKFTVAFIAAF